MKLELLLLGLVLVHPFLVFFLHLVALRLVPPQSPQKHFFVFNLLFQVAWLVGGTVLAGNAVTGGELWPYLAFLLLYSQCVAYAYFHLFNMSETARRIKMLLLIRRGEFDATVQDSYDTNAMVANRIERLTQMKQIAVDEQGRLVIQGRFLLSVAKLFRFYKGLIGIKP